VAVLQPAMGGEGPGPDSEHPGRVQAARLQMLEHPPGLEQTLAGPGKIWARGVKVRRLVPEDIGIRRAGWPPTHALSELQKRRPSRRELQPDQSETGQVSRTKG